MSRKVSWVKHGSGRSLLTVWFFEIVCSQVTIDTVNFFSDFKTSKSLWLISNTVLYLVVYVQANHLRSWKKWLFWSTFLICKRRTWLQTAIPHRSTENTTTPLKKWLPIFSGSDLPVFHFSLQLTLTSIYQRKPQSRSPSILGTVLYHVLQHHASELRQQLYFCPFNEKQDLVISVRYQWKALFVPNGT